MKIKLAKVKFSGKNKYRILAFCGNDGVAFYSNTKKAADGVYKFVKQLLSEMEKLNCSVTTVLIYSSNGGEYQILAELTANKNYLMFTTKNQQLAESAQEFIQDVVNLTEGNQNE